MNPRVQQTLDSDKTLKGIAESLHERISRYRQEQREFDLRSLLCRKFVMGEQWDVIFNGSIKPPDRDEGEVRITANFVKKLYKAHAAEILKNDMAWQVSAFEGDHRRIGISDVGQQVLKHYQQRWKRKQLLHQLMGGIDIDGLAYCSIDYWPNRGRPIGTVQQDGSEAVVPGGMIEHRIVSSLDVLAPDRYRDSDHLPAMFEIVRMHVDDVKERWNLKDAPTAGPDQNEIKERWNSTFGPENKDRDKEVEVFKCWFKAGNGILPEGRYGAGIGFVYCDTIQEVLEIIPFPYPFNDYRVARYPLIDMHCDRRPDHYHSCGIPWELIPLQMQFNKNLSRLAEAGEYMGSPIFRAVRGQFNSEDDIPTYAGGIMYFNPVPGASPPDVVQMPAMNSVVVELMKTYSDVASEVHQIGKVQQAAQEGSVNSYSGLKLLREQASALMGPFVSGWEADWSTIGLVTLMMEAKYRDYPELLLLTDNAADRSVVYFSRADLASDMVVTVDAGVSADSPADDFQKDVQMVQIGAIDKDIIAKKHYGLDKQDDYKRQARDAYNENEQMLNGQPVDNTTIEHMTGDNPAIHVDVHSDVELDPRYANLPPPTKTGIQKHKVIHWIAKNDQATFISQYVKPALISAGYIQEPQPMQPNGVGSPSPMPGVGTAPTQGVA